MSDLYLPHVEKAQHPLAFNPNLFSATQLSGSTIEKEPYEVLFSVEG